MKAVILAGGLGTRLSEETLVKPKPMVEIGGKPLLWHIMKIYSAYGINDFIICCGYKGYMIKEYFANYFMHMSDITFDLANNKMHVHHKRAEPWRVTLVDTGESAMTGGRLLRVREYLKEDAEFFFTYGDGVADIDVAKTLSFHRKHGKLATLSAMCPPGRFGALTIKKNVVCSFREKPKREGAIINGGFFVLSPAVIDLIENDNIVWEQQPLESLAAKGELMAYQHDGFWQPMDTLRDKNMLEELWQSGSAPWKVWI